MFGEAFSGKRVLVTGHTGFKGSWLCEWLLMLGAEVTGYSLPPPTTPALFNQLELGSRLMHTEGDVRELLALRETIERVRPDFIFHLAAQSLVRPSYSAPAETFATNLMGTVNVLEALRGAGFGSDVVIATTDKCYENGGTPHAFDETERLGGRDPYSASKACAELAVEAYRHSFYGSDSHIGIATARAGNVLGGGDWAVDRIVPDCVRALTAGQPILVRNPSATRPWQHVLECLSGYLTLAACLSTSRAESDLLRRNTLRSSFNFGPSSSSQLAVGGLVEKVLALWPGRWLDGSDPTQPHESHCLQLSAAKAEKLLGWRPVWDIDETLNQTIEWYRSMAADSTTSAAVAMTRRQIEDYTSAARAAGVEWAA